MTLPASKIEQELFEALLSLKRALTYSDHERIAPLSAGLKTAISRVEQLQKLNTQLDSEGR
jgi:hypothetical protein